MILKIISTLASKPQKLQTGDVIHHTEIQKQCVFPLVDVLKQKCQHSCRVTWTGRRWLHLIKKFTQNGLVQVNIVKCLWYYAMFVERHYKIQHSKNTSHYQNVVTTFLRALFRNSLQNDYIIAETITWRLWSGRMIVTCLCRGPTDPRTRRY